MVLPFSMAAQPRLAGPLSFNGVQEGGALFRYNLPGNTPGIIHSFNNLSPRQPVAGVCKGDGDWLYGILTYNGTSGNGAFYRIQSDGTGFAILQNLSGLPSGIPYYYTDGQIYFPDNSSIMKFNPATNSFTTVGGFSLSKSLYIDANDWIYYTGANTINKIKTDGTNETVLRTFIPATDGSGGIAGLTETSGDTLFGTNANEGAANGGTLYSIKKDGSGFTVHHQFTAASGIYPESKPVYFDGKLYGTTSQGGNFNLGVLYTIRPDGSGYRVLHHFDPGSPALGVISGDISITSNGRIFGTFNQFYYAASTPYRLFKIDTGGQNFGVFFQVDQRNNGNVNMDVLMTNDETIFFPTREMGRHDGGVMNRCDTSGFGTGLFHFGFSNNGFRPAGGLIKGSDGKLYGTTDIGGADGNGIIFSINQDGTGYTKLHELNDTEGYNPHGRLLEAGDGKLYGVCQLGGSNNSGCIYSLNKNGTGFALVYVFSPITGHSPCGSLVEDNQGILYGATEFGGSGYGVLFKVNKDGTGYTILKTFNNNIPELVRPANGIIISDNYLYGVCQFGGARNIGGVFRIKKDGSAYQVLYEFTGADGSNPTASPIIAGNGKLYGTTDFGGNNQDGTVFRIDTTGSNFTVLKHFSSTIDGRNPTGGLIQASDGLIYGTTFSNFFPPDFGGTLYKMNLDGSGFAVLLTFNASSEGFGPGALMDINGNVVLPVELIGFMAKKTGNSVLLTWKTVSESNSRHFEIERSTDGRQFNTIGSITAAGNSGSTIPYSFPDLSPVDGMNYYRLKQVDLDGAYNFSNIVSINFERTGLVTIAPNPVKDRLTIQLEQNHRFQTISIFDATGKLVIKQNISGANMQIPVGDLPKGWYVLKLGGNDNSSKQYSFVKE